MSGNERLAEPSRALRAGPVEQLDRAESVGRHKPIIPVSCADCPVRHTTVCRAYADSNFALVRQLKLEDRIVRARYKLIDEGECSDHVFNILDGWLAVTATAPSGHRQVLDILMPGAFAGFESPSGEAPRYGLETLTNASLCVFSQHEFRETVRHHMPLLTTLAGTLADQRDRLLVRVDLMSRGAARQRVAFLLLDLLDQARRYSPSFVNGTFLYLPLTQNDLADACGLTNVRLNHVLRSLQRAGVIDYRGKVFEFANLADLERVAGTR